MTVKFFGLYFIKNCVELKLTATYTPFLYHRNVYIKFWFFGSAEHTHDILTCVLILCPMVKLINLIIVSRSKKCLEVHKNPTLVHFKECKLVLGLIVSMSHLVMGICFHRHHFLLVNYSLLVISLYFCICLYPNIIFFRNSYISCF